MCANEEFDDCSMSVRIVDKNLLCVLGSVAEGIPDFHIEVAEVLLIAVAEEGVGRTAWFLGVLRSRKFETKVCKMFLKSFSSCEQSSHSVDEPF